MQTFVEALYVQRSHTLAGDKMVGAEASDGLSSSDNLRDNDRSCSRRLGSKSVGA
jgi:hypothetical protein